MNSSNHESSLWFTFMCSLRPKLLHLNRCGCRLFIFRQKTIVYCLFFSVPFSNILKNPIDHCGSIRCCIDGFFHSSKRWGFKFHNIPNFNIFNKWFGKFNMSELATKIVCSFWLDRYSGQYLIHFAVGQLQIIGHDSLFFCIIYLLQVVIIQVTLHFTK